MSTLLAQLQNVSSKYMNNINALWTKINIIEYAITNGFICSGDLDNLVQFKKEKEDLENIKNILDSFIKECQFELYYLGIDKNDIIDKYTFLKLSKHKQLITLWEENNAKSSS